MTRAVTSHPNADMFLAARLTAEEMDLEQQRH
jgi:hypothetical protein